MADEALPTPGAGPDAGHEPAAYKPPASQEDLDRIISDRLTRERGKYADYDSLRAAAAELAKLKDAQKSDAERQADLLAKLTAERDQLAARDLRRQIADAKGLPAESVDLLTGSTREEIETAADKLAALIGRKAGPEKPDKRPDPSQGQGAPKPRASVEEAREHYRAKYKQS
jgi:hypothetical protein